MASSWSIIMCIKCACRLIVLFRPGSSQACRMSSFNSADTFTTQQPRGRALDSRRLTYRVGIVTAPDIVMLRGMAAGIQTARCE